MQDVQNAIEHNNKYLVIDYFASYRLFCAVLSAEYRDIR